MPFAASIDLGALSAGQGFRMQGPGAADNFAWSADFGDVNGDGFADLLISASGKYAYVILGSAAGWGTSLDLATLSPAAGFRIDNHGANNGFGNEVAVAGDLNGDGFEDLVVSAYTESTVANAGGITYVVYGKPGVPLATGPLPALTGTNGFRLDGAQLAWSGEFVSGAGDVNGDGLDDLLVATWKGDTLTGPQPGVVYLIYGKAGGMPAATSLSALDSQTGVRMAGPANSDMFGFVTAAAGDVNGDGLDDFVVGSPAFNPGGAASAGAAYVVYGRRGGFGAGIDIAALNGSNGFRLQGKAAQDQLGDSVAGLGDVNGDGWADLAVSASGGDGPGRANAGIGYVLFGGPGARPASFDVDSLNGANGFKVMGPAQDVRLGDVLAAGDVNGDGIDDMLVTVAGLDPSGQTDAGGAYLLFGKAAGWGAVVDLGAFTSADGVTIVGSEAGGLVGSVGAAGDLNGDGLGDVLVGSPFLGRNGINYRGGAYVVFGQAGGPSTTGADSFNGTAGVDHYNGLAGADTMRGLGGGDFLRGGPGADASAYAGTASQYEWWSRPDGTWRVKDLRDASPEGTDHLTDIESLQFSDRTVKILGLTTAEKLTDAYQNVLRNTATGSELTFLNNLIADVNGSTKTLSAAIGEIVQKADGTTAVATLSYQFFAGFTPSKGGFDYLVSPQGPNPNNINSAYYQNFSFENRYINFAVNLGKLGEGAAGFQAEYGNKTLFEATKAAYMEIFGGTVTDGKINLILDSDVGNGLTRKDYFAVYGGDGLQGIGTKAAMVGWLLTEAAKADVGMYARSSNAFLADLADGAETRIDLIGTYGSSDYVFNG